MFSLLCIFVAFKLVVSHFDFDSDNGSFLPLLTFYFLEIKTSYIIQRANSKSNDQPALKIISSLVFAHVYTALFIKILIQHVEFYLYFSIIKCTESITGVHTGLYRSCNFVCTEFKCHRPSVRRGSRLS